MPLPNTEETNAPVAYCDDNYRPMAFGPVGRSWLPRLNYAGTYDDQWFENAFPFLPEDFDEAFSRSAPEDQQIDHLKGGELVELINLTPGGHCRFALPRLRVPVEFCRQNGECIVSDALLDTVHFDPDHNRFTLSWRASIPLRRNVFEIPMGIVGRMPKGWYRARRMGKAYYPNLREMILQQNL